MKTSFLFVFLFLLVMLVYGKVLIVFFAQDDFLLIHNFSQNSLLVDLKKAFGTPEVTHWRPFHNLFFLITGNLFSKFYPGYHFAVLLFHVFTALPTFKIFANLLKDKRSGLIASVLYAVHPAHFTSLSWISGSAVNIGFLFLALSIFGFIRGKKLSTSLFYFLSLLASESMVAGLLVLAIVSSFRKRLKKDYKLLVSLFAFTFIFIFVRFLFFTPSETFDVYRIDFSSFISSSRYYLLRILGFAEGQGRDYVSFALGLWLLIIFFFCFKKAVEKSNFRDFLFSASLILVGLFPFVLIPQHLSAHYTVISVFGFSGFVGISLKHIKRKYVIFLLMLFTAISFFSVGKMTEISWVIRRANIAEKILRKIEIENYPSGSILIFDDSALASSSEQYFSLGTGKALDFWLGEKNFSYCFEAFENCDDYLHGKRIF